MIKRITVDQVVRLHELFSRKLAAFVASEIMGQLNRRLLARSVPSVTLNLMSLGSQRPLP